MRFILFAAALTLALAGCSSGEILDRGFAGDWSPSRDGFGGF